MQGRQTLQTSLRGIAGRKSVAAPPPSGEFNDDRVQSEQFRRARCGNPARRDLCGGAPGNGRPLPRYFVAFVESGKESPREGAKTRRCGGAGNMNRERTQMPTAYCYCPLSPVSCPPPVPKHPDRRTGTSSRYSAPQGRASRPRHAATRHGRRAAHR